MLGNFTYSNPTTLHFGADSLNQLAHELQQYGQNILLVYGGGSIKDNGIYDAVMSILKAQHKTVIEDAGVMPNPTVEKLHEGCALIVTHHIDFILAIGGGSVIDYAKALSVSAHCTSDPWQKYFIKMAPVDNFIIPVGCILTMVGTGSEMNGGSVITNTQTKQKIGRIFDSAVFPKFAILNPTYTFTIPHTQMVAGFFDIMSHILEQYFSGHDDTTSDYIMEGLLRSLIHSSEQALRNPNDYEARSNIMWTATWALNTLVAKGKSSDWMVHMIGQAIGGHTNATHGMTLSAVSIPYYTFILPNGLAKFKRFAINVWQVSPDGKDDLTIAQEGLIAMTAWMNRLGLTMNIREFGVTRDMIPAIAEHVFLLDGGYKHLTKADVIAILNESF